MTLTITELAATDKRASDDTAALATTAASNGLGYLVFPPNGQLSAYDRLEQRREKFKALQEERKELEAEIELEAEKDAQAAWEARQEKELATRMAQIKLEEEEAIKGEEAWVRSGGVLRDKDGKRDWPRTRKVKAELELRDKEEASMRDWEDYERRWKKILSGCEEEQLRFADIPWPIPPSKPSVPFTPRMTAAIRKELVPVSQIQSQKQESDINLFSITPSNVQTFLLADLYVRNRTTTRKERIRASMLRWHPDKLTAIRRRVIEEDRESVEAGIRVVFGVLSKLNSAEALEKSVRVF